MGLNGIIVISVLHSSTPTDKHNFTYSILLIVRLEMLVRSVLLIVLVFCIVSCFCVLFVLCPVCPMLPVFLDCPFLIAPSVFSTVYLT